jgi:hypothetical protein
MLRVLHLSWLRFLDELAARWIPSFLGPVAPLSCWQLFVSSITRQESFSVLSSSSLWEGAWRMCFLPVLEVYCAGMLLLGAQTVGIFSIDSAASRREFSGLSFLLCLPPRTWKGS